MPKIDVVSICHQLCQLGKLSPKECPESIVEQEADQELHTESLVVKVDDEKCGKLHMSLQNHEVFLLIAGQTELTQARYDDEHYWNEPLADVLRLADEFDESETILAVITVRADTDRQKKEIVILPRPQKGWPEVMKIYVSQSLKA